MHRATFSMAILALVAMQAFGSPRDAVAAAWTDCRARPAQERPYVRYLSLDVPEKDTRALTAATAFQINSLSREAEIVLPVKVAPVLLRINIADYGWDAKTWEKLAEVDPYYHALIRTEEEVEEVKEFGYWLLGGQQVERGTPGAVWHQTRTEKVKVKKKVTKLSAAAPWLDTQQIADLITMTQSQAPILRTDWFLVQTSQQEGRRGTGYYDFLGLGNKEADFQKLIAADVQAAKRVKKEIAAIIAKSGVTLNNRSITRIQSITGAYWFTQDFKTSVDRQNTLRLLDGDTEPPAGDASEQYGTLPNGLFCYWLQNGKGERQNTAPDFIASDGSASGTDRRVHVGKSCIVCHAEGIRPLDDWARKLYRGAIVLQTPDYEKYKRLRQLYLSDLDGRVKADQQAFAAVLLRVNGLTPAENARNYGQVWDAYQERELTVADVARELGVTSDRLTGAIKQYARTTGSADPLLLGLVQEPAIVIRREHWEEIYGVAQTIMKGYVP